MPLVGMGISDRLAWLMQVSRASSRRDYTRPTPSIRPSRLPTAFRLALRIQRRQWRGRRRFGGTPARPLGEGAAQQAARGARRRPRPSARAAAPRWPRAGAGRPIWRAARRCPAPAAWPSRTRSGPLRQDRRGRAPASDRPGCGSPRAWRRPVRPAAAAAAGCPAMQAPHQREQPQRREQRRDQDPVRLAPCTRPRLRQPCRRRRQPERPALAAARPVDAASPTRDRP